MPSNVKPISETIGRAEKHGWAVFHECSLCGWLLTKRSPNKTKKRFFIKVNSEGKVQRAP